MRTCHFQTELQASQQRRLELLECFCWVRISGPTAPGLGSHTGPSQNGSPLQGVDEWQQSWSPQRSKRARKGAASVRAQAQADHADAMEVSFICCGAHTGYRP